MVGVNEGCGVNSGHGLICWVKSPSILSSPARVIIERLRALKINQSRRFLSHQTEEGESCRDKDEEEGTKWGKRGTEKLGLGVKNQSTGPAS